MNKKEREERYISQLISDLPEKEIKNIDFQKDFPLSVDRIAKFAFEKKNKEEIQMNSKETVSKRGEKPIKFFTKFVAIAAIAGLFSITAFAFSYTEIIINLFNGEKEELIDSAMFTPTNSVEANGVKMATQAVLSDGFNLYMVVSVESESSFEKYGVVDSGDIPYSIFFVTTENGSQISVDCQKLDSFSNGKTQYFLLSGSYLESINETNININLEPDIEPLSLPVYISASLENVSISVSDNTVLGNGVIQDFVISPIGCKINIKQDFPNYVTPQKITMVFKDNSKKEFSVASMADPIQFDEEGVPLYNPESGDIKERMAILDNPMYPANFPLFSQSASGYELDGSLTMVESFSEVIDIENLKEVVIDGVSYPVNLQK